MLLLVETFTDENFLVLNYGLFKKSLRNNVEHFFLHKKIPFCEEKKVFNLSELHFSEVDFVRSHFGKNATLTSIVLQVPFWEEKSGPYIFPKF